VGAGVGEGFNGAIRVCVPRAEKIPSKSSLTSLSDPAMVAPSK